MIEYEFTLKFSVPPIPDADRHVDALAEAGCDDAVVGIGKPGCIALEFARTAESAEAAVTSAVADVRRAIPQARLLESAPDLVGLSDLATLLGCTRQNMRKLVLGWLRARKGMDVDSVLAELASVTLRMNLARDAARLPKPPREWVRLVG